MNDTKTDPTRLAKKWIIDSPEEASKDSDYYCPTRDIFQARIDRMLGNLLAEKAIDVEDAYMLSAITGEIGNNSFDHNLGKWPNVAGIFFSYSVSKKVEIVLADRGQGILTTLKTIKPELSNDTDALQTAFLERVSGRAPERRGNGLKFVKEGIKSRKMHLTFISGNAQAELNEIMEISETKNSIGGCLAIITL